MFAAGSLLVLATAVSAAPIENPVVAQVGDSTCGAVDGPGGEITISVTNTANGGPPMNFTAELTSLSGDNISPSFSNAALADGASQSGMFTGLVPGSYKVTVTTTAGGEASLIVGVVACPSPGGADPDPSEDEPATTSQGSTFDTGMKAGNSNPSTSVLGAIAAGVTLGAGGIFVVARTRRRASAR